MSSIIWGLILSALAGFGGSSSEIWNFYDTFVLKKDQVQHVRIYAKQKKFFLSFRWTLFKNGGLVMHVQYNNHFYQPLLFADYKREAFKIDLFSKPNDGSALHYETPYALLIFKTFDIGGKKAHLDLKIKSDVPVEVLYTKGK